MHEGEQPAAITGQDTPAPQQQAEREAENVKAAATSLAAPEPILRTIPAAMGRINDLHTFYRNEMIRAETVFSSLLLPASLTFVSALAFTHTQQALVSAQWGLVAFFSTYLVILFINLCGLQWREKKVLSLQNALFALPSDADNKTVSEFPNIQSSYRVVESAVGYAILTRPVTKIVISLVVAIIAIVLSLVL